MADTWCGNCGDAVISFADERADGTKDHVKLCPTCYGVIVINDYVTSCRSI